MRSQLALVTALGCLIVSIGNETWGQDAKIDDLIKVEFPKDGYRFKVDEVAKGIKITYKVVIAKDIEGMMPSPFGPSFHEPAGPSGLHPREKIFGNGQLYALLDFGLAFPPKIKPRTLKKGTYTHTFDWDGRNWTGPSDTGNPKGKPFPPGTYELSIEMHGNRVLEKVMMPYEIKGKTKLVLE